LGNERFFSILNVVIGYLHGAFTALAKFVGIDLGTTTAIATTPLLTKRRLKGRSMDGRY
jgi:hypothetical protein